MPTIDKQKPKTEVLLQESCPLPGRRVLLLILDGVGIGSLPDAAKYGDRGGRPRFNMSAGRSGGLEVPCLQGGLGGLGNIASLVGGCLPIRLHAPPTGGWPCVHRARIPLSDIGRSRA